MDKVIIDGLNLTVEKVALVARGGVKIELSEKAKVDVEKSAKMVERFVKENKIIYGITTGFGSMSEVYINPSDTAELQRNLLLSHCCGVGEPLSIEETRACMLVRINSLVKGYSGIRLSTLNRLIEYLNKGIHPVIPRQGSVGASGDLCPLAHMSVTLLGLGEVFYKGQRRKTEDVLKELKIEPITLAGKEGLALINGTSVMAGVASMVIYDAKKIARLADVAASISFEALHGVPWAFDKRIHELRPYNGQIAVAKNLCKMIENSEIVEKYKNSHVQDCYSLRCAPQIHGASRDAIDHVESVLNKEINSVTDNPILFQEDNVALSGGNFHGQPIAINMDYLGIALAELANVSERRTARLVDTNLSGLPPYLIKDGGLNSGFMITQYASAAIVSENKVLAHPSSVDSIPTSANQEDHVSMGAYATIKARSILKNTRRVIAIELLVASQALDFSKPLKAGKGTTIAHKTIREIVPFIEKDVLMHDFIEKVLEKVIDGSILDKVIDKIDLL